MKALVTGITGQIGSYLAEHLLDLGSIEVYGLVRRSSTNNLGRISHLLKHIQLIQGDLADQTSLDTAVRQVQPDFIFNLAAQSFVPVSWTQPEHTSDVTGLGALRMLEAMRKYAPSAHFYEAASSEQFGRVQETPQTEKTPFYPRSPYGAAKAFAFYMTKVYRESYNLYACSGLMFNSESSRRGEDFVTRKITKAAARIKLGKQQKLELGNLTSKRDWIHAKDAVRAMWAIANQVRGNADIQDYVFCSGVTHTVEDFLSLAFRYAGLDWAEHVIINPQFLRPAEVDLLLGDPTKIREDLKWQPEISFEDLVEEMVEADLMAESARE